MIPRAAVVASPRGGVALGPSKCGTCEHKRAEIGLKTEHALVSCARILHAEDVVDLAMVGFTALDAVYGVQRHGLVGALEYRRLVHVIPEATNPPFHKISVQRAPPLAHLCPREIRENALARPHLSDVHGPIWILDEVIVRQAFIVRFVAGQLREVQIGDGDDLESFIPQILHHPLKVGEPLAINGERTFVLLIIDIEINDIGRNLAFAELTRNFANPGLGIIAVAALLISQ